MSTVRTESDDQGSLTRCRYSAVGSAIAGAVLWLFSIGFVLADLSLHDRVPDSLPTALGLLGTLAVGAALTLWTRAATVEMVEDAVNRAYRRGLVNGAQQLADGAARGLRQVP